MKISDVIFDDLGSRIEVHGKGKSGFCIRLTTGSKYLKSWIDEHPLKNITGSPLWIKYDGVSHTVKPINDKWVRETLTKLAEKADVKKPMRINIFRHTVATNYIRNGMPVPIWEKAMRSTRIKDYVHLIDKDVDRSIVTIENKNNLKKQFLELSEKLIEIKMEIAKLEMSE